MSGELRTTRLTGNAGHDKPCEANGRELNSTIAIMFGVGRCPECNALVSTDAETGKIEDHTVFVIGDGPSALGIEES